MIPLRLVELLRGADQPDVPLVDQVGEARRPGSGSAWRPRRRSAGWSGPACSRASSSPARMPPGELGLPLAVDQRVGADLAQVLIQGLGLDGDLASGGAAHGSPCSWQGGEPGNADRGDTGRAPGGIRARGGVRADVRGSGADGERGSPRARALGWMMEERRRGLSSPRRARDQAVHSGSSADHLADPAPAHVGEPGEGMQRDRGRRSSRRTWAGRGWRRRRGSPSSGSPRSCRGCRPGRSTSPAAPRWGPSCRAWGGRRGAGRRLRQEVLALPAHARVAGVGEGVDVPRVRLHLRLAVRGRAPCRASPACRPGGRRCA